MAHLLYRRYANGWLFLFLLFRRDVLQLPQDVGKACVLRAVDNIGDQQQRVGKGDLAVAVHVAVRGDRDRGARVADAGAVDIALDPIGLGRAD